MAESKRSKPKKPRPTFPMWPHGSGQWAAKLGGKTYYFGKWDDPEAAEKRYSREAPYLRKGEVPPPETVGADVTLEQVAFRFLDEMADKLASRELSQRSFNCYHRTCQTLAEYFGRSRTVNSIDRQHWRNYRKHLLKRLSLTSLNNEISRIVSLMNFGYDEGMVQPVPVAKWMERPEKSKRDAESQKRGPKLFSKTELTAIIEAVQPNPVWHAIVLLGINCGFGNSDVGSLPRYAIDLDGGWIDFPRVKTAVPRRIPLWPETVEALRLAIAARPKPRRKEWEPLVFITLHGRPYVRVQPRRKRSKKAGPEEMTVVDSISPEFKKVLRGCEIERGINFYGLRHTFATHASECRDQIAVDHVMGHKTPGMGTTYRHAISDDRLRAAVDAVRNWLFSK